METSKFKYFGIGVILSFMVGFHFYSKGVFRQAITLTTTDTLYIDRPYKVEVIKEVEVPQIVRVYQRDTVYRNQLEKDTLITFVEITPKEAHIHTITPLGKPTINTYPIEDYSLLQINHKGSLKRRRKKRFWRNLERVGFLLGGFVSGMSIK
jgi:hypothetical protein